MGAPPNLGASAPPPSALQSLLDTHLISSDDAHPKHLCNLALQILHNLQYQHLWTELRIHTHSPLTSAPLPRPLLSGLPPQRLYIHPDEQIELLQQQKDAGKTGMPELRSEREWVLPSHLREKWSLRRFGEVFDGVCLEPPAFEDDAAGRDADSAMGYQREFQANAQDIARAAAESAATPVQQSSSAQPNKWRTSKRLLLATLDDDSTVVYYIVHDGIVKPRQN